MHFAVEDRFEKRRVFRAAGFCPGTMQKRIAAVIKMLKKSGGEK